MEQVKISSDKLLAGMTFISTRPKGKSREMSEYFSSFGARLIEMPMIETSPILLDEKDCMTISKLDRFNWIVFTSQNGVDHFFHHLKRVDRHLKLPEKTRIAAVGEKTAQALDKNGWPVHFINKKKTSEGLAKDLALNIENGAKVLLPLGNLAGETLNQHLGKITDITRINVYQTRKPRKLNKDYLQQIKNDQYGMIICTSPSGFNNLYAVLALENKLHLRIACIGETTERAIKNKGIKPLVVAKNTNSKSIVDAVVNYYQKKPK